ncbi:hypothetical protein HZA38_00050 [Candidatus Peregrinibacteria bacterium]|nr:hypothetical protein [Candidatus Peregrinibacteria bacterium]
MAKRTPQPRAESYVDLVAPRVQESPLAPTNGTDIIDKIVCEKTKQIMSQLKGLVKSILSAEHANLAEVIVDTVRLQITEATKNTLVALQTNGDKIKELAQTMAVTVTNLIFPPKMKGVITDETKESMIKSLTRFFGEEFRNTKTTSQ